MARKSNSKSENKKIAVFDDPAKMIEAFVQLWIGRARKALIDRGNFSAALSGGKTPGPFYHALSTAVTETIWQNSHLYMVDERHVPHSHADSNWGMIQREIIRNVSISEGNLHPVPFAKTAEESAVQYEKELRRFFGRSCKFPAIDFLVMGLGPDGHTASLFPGSPALYEKVRWSVASRPETAPHSRITLTFPVIQNAAEVVYIIKGKDKAVRVKEILVDGNEYLPATRAQSRDGKTIYLLDQDAAGLLEL